MANGLSPKVNADACGGVTQFYLQGPSQVPIDGTFPAGSFTTETAILNHSKTWQVQTAASGGASGTITFQQSADGVAWDDLANVTDIPIPLNDSLTIESFYVSGLYLRAVYTETTAGTLSITLTEKS